MNPFLAGSRALALVVAAAALFAGCNRNPPAVAAMAPPPPEVSVVMLQSERVALTRELPGRIHPLVIAEVRPQVNGIVRELSFAEGSVVKAGEVLYQLEDDMLRADLAAAQAQLARAEALAAATRATAARTAELAKIEAVSRQENDNAAAAQRQAEADVAAAKAALARSEVLMRHTRIAAPISGRIGKSSVTRGALVTANQAQALVTVQQLDPIYVDVKQSSTELLALRRELTSGKAKQADLPVKIVLEDGSSYEHPGKLKFADVSVDAGTGSYLLRIVVPNPQGMLLPGMFVRAQLSSAVRQEGLLVPQRAVARDAKGNASVLLLADDGVVQARPVLVSSTVGDAWLVEDGLTAGERVIVEGLQKIRPGAPARIAPSAPAPLAAKK